MPELTAQYGLILVGIIIYAGEIGLPTLVPGEIALLVAGSHAIHSVPSLLGALAAFAVVDVLACSSIHGASRTGGNRLLLALLRKLQPNSSRHEAVIEGWRARLGGRDALVVFVTRLIPIFRLYSSITTGLVRIRFRDFITGAVPAATIWAATPLTVGYLLRGQVGAVTSQYPVFLHVVIVGSVVTTLLAAGVCWKRRGSAFSVRQLLAR
jgi:membrane protein DedA with SNARE-associated domain